jgi:hypothetical protein
MNAEFSEVKTYFAWGLKSFPTLYELFCLGGVSIPGFFVARGIKDKQIEELPEAPWTPPVWSGTKTNFIAAWIKMDHYRSTYLYQLSFCKQKNTKYKHRPRPINKSLPLNDILQFPVFSKLEYVENAYKNSDNDYKINIFCSRSRSSY